MQQNWLFARKLAKKKKSKTIYVTIKDPVSRILPHFIIKQYDVIHDENVALVVQY